MAKDIILTAINAKWIHPSPALRLLKANLGELEDRCEIIEFALRQPLSEKTEPLKAFSKIIGISVSVWNHTAAIELLKELKPLSPVIVLGGPEVSHLAEDAEIFKFADYVIRGEGEDAFRTLCEDIISGKKNKMQKAVFIEAENVNVNKIKSAYHLYTDEDINKKLIYVESSRGCPFNCAFCVSAVKKDCEKHSAVREFPLEPFFTQMDALIKRGVKTFKFLDRSFNVNIKRALRIMDFFLGKLEERAKQGKSFTVHFEMVPSLFPPALLEKLSLFPPGTLRLEIGIQTLNSYVAGIIKRHPHNPEKELENIRRLSVNTNAVIHADLIAGLPGEDYSSFAKGFDRLFEALSSQEKGFRSEIQLGILKILPGTPINNLTETHGIKFNSSPPYEVTETQAMPEGDLERIKNFARFWETIINRRLIDYKTEGSVFESFMSISDRLLNHFGRNWGIDKNDLLNAAEKML